jgi:hypothetical protein
VEGRRRRIDESPRFPLPIIATRGVSSTMENPYLALREAKIARNQARLRELGLVPALDVAKPQVRAACNTRQQTTTATSDGSPIRRRSIRISQLPSPPLEEEENEGLPQRPKLVQKRKLVSAQESMVPPRMAKTAAASPAQPKLKLNSVRSVHLDVNLLVLGNGKSIPGLLGTQMEKTGKDFVIHHAFEKAASNEDQLRLAGTSLSFNKYSGVQEWGNDVAFLWVNIRDKGKSVVNDFPEGGKFITWFGGSRMHDDSPVILQLSRLGKQAAQKEQKEHAGRNTEISPTSSTLPSASGIVLWCRVHHSETRTFGPYICLGRLAYESHVPGSSPMKFVWMLLDYDKLENHPDKAVRQTFQSVIAG